MNIPIRDVRDPSPFIEAGISFENRLESQDYVDWADEIESKRKALWVDFELESKRAKKERSERFRELYKREAKKNV